MTLNPLIRQWPLLSMLLINNLSPVIGQEVEPSKAPHPLYIPSVVELKQRIKSELRATRPDYVVFVPKVTNTEVSDTGNEHFLVFDGPDGSLMAVWT